MNVAECAQLALLLEVAATPKPGNVDRCRDHPGLHFSHFLAGAVGARSGLEAAADPDGPGVGEAFEGAVAGMGRQSGGNTQFGALLLVVPLARTAATGDLSRDRASSVVEATTVEDAAGFYRAFDHVDVSVAEPPEGWGPLDVRRGSDAVPALRERGLTLEDVMAASAGRDGVAREWVEGFERSFRAAALIAPDDDNAADRPLTDRAATAYLELLAEEPDTFVAIRHGESTARSVSERARDALEGAIDPDDLADELVAEGVNPGTTADLVAAGLFVALARGEASV